MSKTLVTPESTTSELVSTLSEAPATTPEATAAPEGVRNSHRLRLGRRFAGPAPDLEALIPRFHAWIRDRELPWTLIDVTDYRHVEQGPGVLLVGVEGDVMVGFDEDGRALVAYVQKRNEGGDFEAHLDRAFERLDAVVRGLADLDGFEALATNGEWAFRLLDRLVTRHGTVAEELAAWFSARLDLELGTEVVVERDAFDPRRAEGLLARPAIAEVPEPLAPVVA